MPPAHGPGMRIAVRRLEGGRQLRVISRRKDERRAERMLAIERERIENAEPAFLVLAKQNAADLDATARHRQECVDDGEAKIVKQSRRISDGKRALRAD